VLFSHPCARMNKKGITTGSRICSYKIYILAFQAIGLLI
jgi:hypothetical protein